MVVLGLLSPEAAASNQPKSMRELGWGRRESPALTQPESMARLLAAPWQVVGL